MKSIGWVQCGVLAVVLMAGSGARQTSAQQPELTNVGALMDRVVPVLVNNKGERVEYPLIREKPYILFYWSASWCGPCRRFTPQLVDVYNKLGGGERFEVILISADRSEEKMNAYMKDMNMPWYGIAYDQRKGTGVSQFAAGGIPHLMLIDKDGKILGRGRGQAGNVLRQLITLLAPQSPAPSPDAPPADAE